MLVISVLFLTSCSLIGSRVNSHYLSWQGRQSKIEAINQWYLTGVLSITSQRNRELIHFNWEQIPGSYVLYLSGPLNFGKARVEGTAHEVVLWRSKQRCLKAKNPEELLFKYYGWQLPVSNLRYWILGIFAPEGKVAAQSFDQEGRLATFTQDGWQVRYLTYNYNIQYHIDLPKLIELRGYQMVIKMRIA